jgi:hypothetical protein
MNELVLLKATWKVPFPAKRRWNTGVEHTIETVGVERTYRRARNDANQQDELQELTLMSLNIRGFNGEEKQQVIGELIHQEKPHVICLNETKLTIPVYLDNYWSHQTVL